MGKYIIEIPDDKVQDFVGSTHLLMPYSMAGHIGHHDTGLPIEPYTAPDLEQIRKEAYEQGRKEAEDHYDDGYSDGYDAGLDDAWKAARGVGHCKLWGDYTKDTGKTSVCAVDVLDYYSASEAIEKLKAYEQKEIKVGDEVNAPFGKAIVVNVDSNAEKIWFLYADGRSGFDFFKNTPTKTGRHFPEIAEVLQKMRGEQDG